MRLSQKKLAGVALSIRKRHFQNLLEQCQEARREITAARCSRRRRAHLLWLVRKHRLSCCRESLRPKGMTLRTGSGVPYITYDHMLTRVYLAAQKARSRQIREEWKRLKEESAKPIAANLKTLLQEAELTRENPLEVRWVVGDITIEDVWIGDIEVTLNLEEFDIHAWNQSVDTDDKHGCQHPHVSSDGRICWNDHMEEAQAYHASGDFLALKDMIENLLRTYNSHSPYITLEDWADGYGEACAECGERYHDDDLRYSERYGEGLCENCSCYCDRCEDYVPDGHYDSRMEACDRCVEQDSDVCALCLERLWRNELKTIEITVDGKKETVPCCEACKEQYESEQEEKQDEKEDNDHEPERDDHVDRACLLAPGVALPPDG